MSIEKMKKIGFVIINFFVVTLVAEHENFLLKQIKTCLLEEKIQNYHFAFSTNVSDEMFAQLSFIFDEEMLTTISYQKW